MKLIQVSCRESNKIDHRQADAVLRHRPQAIIFESPIASGSYEDVCNAYPPHQKPLNIITERKAMIRRVGKKYPWVLSDVRVYDNVVTLWKEGHDVKLYHVDGPAELLHIDTPGPRSARPSRRGSHLFWWVRIFLRETYMTRNIKKIFGKKELRDATVLVFLQKFHWLNVQFRLTNPSKRELWEYYFGKFKNTDRTSVGRKIKDFNQTLYTYWQKDTSLK